MIQRDKSTTPAHEHHGIHGHTHGAIPHVVLSTRRGIRAVQWSFVVLILTALFQAVIVALTGSVALLADTIHNIGDAATAIPLWIAFLVARLPPTRRFTYGYGRIEDAAGAVIVLTIVVSAAAAGYQSISRILNPQPIAHLWAVILAALIGFIGNEGVAALRIRVGKEIHSAALVADGYHARADGITSLGVGLGAVFVWLGFPAADPLVGILITAAILRIAWSSGKEVFFRIADGVDPQVIEEIHEIVEHTQGVRAVTEVRVRWLGHQMCAEVNLSVVSGLSVAEGHAIAVSARHQLLHQLPYLSNITIHVDPDSDSGEKRHQINNHSHGEMGAHSHL